MTMIDTHCPVCGDDYDSIESVAVNQTIYTDDAWGINKLVVEYDIACPRCGNTNLDDYNE